MRVEETSASRHQRWRCPLIRSVSPRPGRRRSGRRAGCRGGCGSRLPGGCPAVPGSRWSVVEHGREPRGVAFRRDVENRLARAVATRQNGDAASHCRSRSCRVVRTLATACAAGMPSSSRSSASVVTSSMPSVCAFPPSGLRFRAAPLALMRRPLRVIFESGRAVRGRAVRRPRTESKISAGGGARDPGPTPPGARPCAYGWDCPVRPAIFESVRGFPGPGGPVDLARSRRSARVGARPPAGPPRRRPAARVRGGLPQCVARSSSPCVIPGVAGPQTSHGVEDQRWWGSPATLGPPRPAPARARTAGAAQRAASAIFESVRDSEVGRSVRPRTESKIRDGPGGWGGPGGLVGAGRGGAGRGGSGRVGAGRGGRAGLRRRS